jgi:hypothetical protein
MFCVLRLLYYSTSTLYVLESNRQFTLKIDFSVRDSNIRDTDIQIFRDSILRLFLSALNSLLLLIKYFKR